MSEHLEEIYMILYGASNDTGIKYNVILKWFTECGIVDGRFLTEEHFTRSYERVCPNREQLSLARFIQLMGILSRDTRQELEVFVTRFQEVKRIVIEELVESRRDNDYRYS